MSTAPLDWTLAEPLIRHALAEDLGSGDVTTAALLGSDKPVDAEIISKDEGVIAGMPLAERVFHMLDSEIKSARFCQDGENVLPGKILLQLHGSARAILAGERTALNLLGRCSGIATLTGKFVEAVRNTGAKILDTRKTAPLLRVLDRYAVRAGGGVNHRQGLYDMILLKENHIKLARGIARALSEAVAWRKKLSPSVKIEVEVTNLNELKTAMQFEIDRVMLDNFSSAMISQAVAQAAGRVELEASGGVSLENVAQIAQTGVQFISVGALTHSVKNFDLTLLLK